MPRYRHKVIKECFIGDVFRTPDKHNMVVTDEPFTEKTLPSALQPLDYSFDDDGNPTVEFPDEPEVDDGLPDATPDAIALAAEYGIDLETVDGSGKNGRITKGDVKALIPED